MLYPFMTFPDETEIVHSGVLHQGEQELVIVKTHVSRSCYG